MLNQTSYCAKTLQSSFSVPEYLAKNLFFRSPIETLTSATLNQILHSLIISNDGAIWKPHFGERRGGLRGSAMSPLERAMVVSYRLSIVTVALSVTIRPQFAIKCLRRSNQQGWVTLGPNLGVFPLEQTRHVGVARVNIPG